MQKYRPLGNRVMILIDSKEEVSKGGIIIPTEMRESKSVGMVKAIGAKVEEVAVGDKVLFDKYGGLRLEDSTVNIITEEDIIAVLED